MRNIWVIFQKEVHSFFSSLIAYIVMSVFLGIVGFFVWIAPSNTLQMGTANLQVFFTFAPLAFMFLIPAITMRAIAEEKKTGTFEFLVTRPVSEYQILIGKFLAAALLAVLCVVPTLVYLFTVQDYALPKGNIDWGAAYGAYLGLTLVGISFCALGILASSLTDNQIVAFILGFFLCFAWFKGFGLIADLFTHQVKLHDFIDALGLENHYVSISRGVIDLRDVIYFISFSIACILVSKTIIEVKK
ncbi:MAG: ABC transporter permease subunit [Bacteroidia bacterium]|nr:ABC transporter permease subunit [Bacteroidia bacterium]MDW8348447.1 ABC transporter permease subunit [Bacteroidia bacterium]